MSRHPTLGGISRWITAPSLAGAIAGAALAVAYGLLTLHLVPGTRAAFALMALGACILGTWSSELMGQRRVRTIRGVGEGTLPVTVPNLQRAAQEVASLPDRTFLVNEIAWTCGCILVAVCYRLLPGVESWDVTVRIGLLGVGLGPMVAMLIYLFELPRARESVARITAAGLTPAEAIAAIPTRRNQLRTRLMVLTAVAGITPALLIADVVMARTDEAVEQLISAPAPGQALRAAELAQRIDFPMVALAVALVAVAIGTAVLAGSALVRPLRAIAQMANRIARGELVSAQLIPAEDEEWAASAAFATMQGQLVDALARLRGAGLRISSTTDQLLSATAAQQAGSAEQAASLNETTATTEELARSARQIAENGGAVAEIAERMLGAVQAGQRSSQTFFGSMVRMKDDNQRIADSVLKLNKRVQQIGKIVEFIHEIGDKSDLLALNAELEGTKAGDVGRGFSLVAAEMRRLAENVIRSTHEIERIIDEIRDGTNAAVMATESGLKAMDAGTHLATGVLQSLSAILEQARQTSEAVRAISLSTQQQQSGTDQLAEALTEILRITDESSGAEGQMAKANQVLSGLAGSLKEVVEQFRIGGEAE